MRIDLLYVFTKYFVTQKEAVLLRLLKFYANHTIKSWITAYPIHTPTIRNNNPPNIEKNLLLLYP